MAKTHKLKILLEFAILHSYGMKSWELRVNDRVFKRLDKIEFTIVENGVKYSETILHVYVGTEYGLKKGFCILSITDNFAKMI